MQTLANEDRKETYRNTDNELQTTHPLVRHPGIVLVIRLKEAQEYLDANGGNTEHEYTEPPVHPPHRHEDNAES